jgi:putative tryptophan/tyrosine transport system substrate-binding protein
MRRRMFMTLLGGAAAAWPFASRAQPARALQVVGFLSPGFPPGPASFTGLKDSLRELGYVEGETIKMEARWGHGKTETLPGFAEELVRLKVDVIVAIARPSIEAAKAATSELPIVGIDLESDPIASGFVTTLAAPGGNITGLFLDLPSLAGKWLQLVREVAPDAQRIAILWDANTGEYQLRAMSDAAKAMSMDLRVIEFRNAMGMENALTAGLKEGPQALIQLGSPLINQLANRIADISATHRIPAISPFRAFSDSGGVMSYGPVLSVWYRRLGRYVSTILKGAKPAAMPVERPTNFEFIVNLKAATAMGVKIPLGMLLRADEVIE